jgi:hypothetical protein
MLEKPAEPQARITQSDGFTRFQLLPYRDHYISLTRGYGPDETTTTSYILLH